MPPAEKRAKRDPTRTVSLDEIDGWIFDLDGVITDTASLHQKAWSEMFEELFSSLAAAGTARAPRGFTPGDYRRLVDGEDRVDGVRNVLADRGIALPEGGSDDAPGAGSVSGLAKEKDGRYLALLEQEGPRPFPSSVELIRNLKAAGLGIAVVSASRHCKQVLEAAGLAALVDVRVDGYTATAMQLAGKPDPAMFIEAARRLGVEPSRAVVVEDALAGVEAARRGGFRIVVGVGRSVEGADLKRRGAHIVVADLADVAVTGTGPSASPWWLTYDDPGNVEEGVIETLCTLANGYVGTRGARSWSRDDGFSYPGTYLAGVYNRLDSEVSGELVEVESLVNAPNWLPITFRADHGAWLGSDGARVSDHRIRLDLRCGLLLNTFVVTDRQGRRTAVIERRIVSMGDPHLVALELSCIPINWSGRLDIRSGLDGSVVDDETVEDRLLSNRHLEFVDQTTDERGGISLQVRTVQSHVTIAMAARVRITAETSGRHRGGGAAGSPSTTVSVPTSSDIRTTVCKTVAVFTSRDPAISEPGVAAREAVADAPGFEELLDRQRSIWGRLWRKAEVAVTDQDGSASVVNLHLFHLLQVASPNVIDMDAGLGARGLHGEGYRGHVFWDSMFVFPVVTLHFPEVSRAVLAYRRRRLPAARKAAIEAGYAGAMFPWQSGSDGRDETPTMLFNPRSGRWMPDRSRFERHVGLAVAYESWQYWQVTANSESVSGPGAEVFFEIARFFASLARWDDSLGRYRISGVVGPDEFHDGYPWSSDPGVTDNAYTNVMTSWLLWRACELAELLAAQHRTEAAEMLGIGEAEIARWDSISRKLHVPFHDGVISQFAGYERLEPFDFDAYRARYGNIGRLDLILEAEGDAVSRYQVCKQADVLMILYLLSAEEARAVLGRMGYPLEADTIRATVDYYSERVTHGSTLSRIVHAWVLARADRQASWRYFQGALESDITDSQLGTTREGIHLGAMAGTVDILERCYAGLESRDGALWLHPLLPPELSRLRFMVEFQGNEVTVDVDRRRLRVESAAGREGSATLMISGEPLMLEAGQAEEVPIHDTS